MQLASLLALAIALQQLDVEPAAAQRGRVVAEAAGSVAVDPRAPLALGHRALLEGNADEAIRRLERALEHDADNAEAHRWLARAYARKARRSNRFQQAAMAGRIRRHFEAAVRLAPDDVRARRDLLQFYLIAPRIVGGGRDRAEAQARALAERDPMQGRIAAAWLAETGGDVEGAKRELQAAIGDHPDRPEPLLALGALQQRAREWEAALATYRRLAARHPSERETQYQLGRVASESGHALADGAAALEQFVAGPASEEDAALATAWHRLGAIRERQGDRPRAAAAYRRALELDPGMDESRRALERVAKR